MVASRASSRRRSVAFLGVALVLSLLCVAWVCIILWLWSSPTSYDAEETLALAKFVARTLGDSLPEPPGGATADEGGRGGSGGGTVYVFGFTETDDNVGSVSLGVRRTYSDLISAGHPDVKILMFDILNDGSKEDRLERRVPNFSGSKKLLQLIRSPPSGASGGTASDGPTHHLPHPPTYPDSFEIHPWKHSSANTLREAKAAISHTRTARALVVVAPAYHLPRAFLTVLSAASTMAPHLHIYASPGLPLRWDEQVAHSQGLLVGDRESVLDAELERMFVYNRKGDLMKPSEALEALRKRDRRLF